MISEQRKKELAELFNQMFIKVKYDTFDKMELSPEEDAYISELTTNLINDINLGTEEMMNLAKKR